MMHIMMSHVETCGPPLALVARQGCSRRHEARMAGPRLARQTLTALLDQPRLGFARTRKLCRPNPQSCVEAWPRWKEMEGGVSETALRGLPRCKYRGSRGYFTSGQASSVKLKRCDAAPLGSFP